MQLILNGIPRDIPGADTLQRVVDTVVLDNAAIKDSDRVIAELNGKIIKRGNWSATMVQKDDSLELVSFVGGG